MSAQPARVWSQATWLTGLSGGAVCGTMGVKKNMILVPEPEDQKEHVAGHFLAGYSEADTHPYTDTLITPTHLKETMY